MISFCFSVAFGQPCFSFAVQSFVRRVIQPVCGAGFDAISSSHAKKMRI